ncbi:hypothetical protein ACX93W_01870 [Paenibacillus sp. CAU 1782]
MTRQKMLHVKWPEQEEATYYVDKDEYSKAHETADTITLKAYEGTYTFDKTSLQRGRSAIAPFLYTGTQRRQASAISWKFFETPTQ